MISRAQGVIERQVSQMVRLIDDLLDLSRITRGRIELRLEAVDLRSVVKSGVETSRPLIEERGHQLAVNLLTRSCTDQDPVRVPQVIANSQQRVSSPTRGRIASSVPSDGDRVVLGITATVSASVRRLSRIFGTLAQRGAQEFCPGGSASAWVVEAAGQAPRRRDRAAATDPDGSRSSSDSTAPSPP
jgi:light-regulated signal transduction histidine kinase (bacteriophytochrome)